MNEIMFYGGAVLTIFLFVIALYLFFKLNIKHAFFVVFKMRQKKQYEMQVKSKNIYVKQGKTTTQLPVMETKMLEEAQTQLLEESVEMIIFEEVIECYSERMVL